MDILYLEVNIFAILILIILACASKIFNSEQYLLTQRVFVKIIIANIIILILDCIAFLSIYQDVAGGSVLGFICLSFCFAFSPTLSFFYAEYYDIQMGLSQEKIKRRKLFYLIPSLTAIILTTVNIFTPILFSVPAEGNLYQKGPLFAIAIFYSSFLMVFTVVRALVQLRNSSRQKIKELLAMISFVIFPVVGIIVQVLIPDIPVVYVAMVLSILVVYIMIQNSQVYRDPLTDVHNRRQLLPYLKWCIQKQDDEHKKHFVMIDVDNFKMINDCYGHLVGDNVLITIAKTLKSNCNKKEFIARFGGDEFVWIMMGRTEKEISEIFIKINEQLQNSKVLESGDLKIALTYGYVEFGNEDVDPEVIISCADKKMYELKNKRNGKNQ